MQIPVSAILTILAIGSVLLMPLLFLPTLRHGVSVAIHKRWFAWPVLLLFALLFWPNDSVQTYTADVDLGTQRLLRIVITCGLFLVLLPRFLKEPIWLKRSILNWYLLYILACLVSVIYSLDWREALWKSFELVVILMIASVVRIDIRRGLLTLNEILSIYMLLLFVTVLFAFIGWLTFPQYGYDQWSFLGSESLSRSLGGIVPRISPNSLGQFAAMVLFAGVASWVLSGKLGKENLIFIVTGGIVLVLAHARSSIAAVALLIMILLLASKQAAGKLLLLPILVFSALGAEPLIGYYMRGQDIDQFQSLSGRTHMWEIAWQSILENPWFGIGFAGHKTLNISIGMEYSTLDSTYIEAFVNVGVFGASFLLLFILLVMIRMTMLFIQSVRTGTAFNIPLVVAAGFIFLMFVRSLSGASFQVLHWNLLMLLTLVVATLESIPSVFMQAQSVQSKKR
ncbi:O-antigen ligase [Nitrosomonas sp. Nm166]|uniref:O-antigen ligase family protein n=1 Tax=Nitrosomonas sp. Nm166 TaxID=1881054 RepID=UPI0008DFDFF8|nr:O-antigen ligase family protein [Nitrosomonas sp. Nm166]SFD91528.1 O-antigen ligase [Nitrosomonas sp. Nm166]